MPSFSAIYKRATKRKGGETALRALLPQITPPKQIAKLGDARILSEMTMRVFCSGFVWKVIEKKWLGFEKAFLGFDAAKLLRQPPDFWEKLSSNKEIVRNAQKIMSVQKNAEFIADIAAEHGSFGKFLADWPAADQVGLMALLAKQGSRLGGNTGQYFLRFIGKDCFMLTRDVVLCLRDAELEIAEAPTSKRDLAAIQQQFNTWAEETGLPYTHLSRICAFSIESHPPEQLHSYERE